MEEGKQLNVWECGLLNGLFCFLCSIRLSPELMSIFKIRWTF